jgi:hypothetical protein
LCRIVAATWLDVQLLALEEVVGSVEGLDRHVAVDDGKVDPSLLPYLYRYIIST